MIKFLHFKTCTMQLPLDGPMMWNVPGCHHLWWVRLGDGGILVLASLCQEWLSCKKNNNNNNCYLPWRAFWLSSPSSVLNYSILSPKWLGMGGMQMRTTACRERKRERQRRQESNTYSSIATLLKTLILKFQRFFFSN